MGTLRLCARQVISRSDMRLRNYLNEKIREVDMSSGHASFDDITLDPLGLAKLRKLTELIEKNCKKFIREIKPARHFLYR